MHKDLEAMLQNLNGVSCYMNFKTQEMVKKIVLKKKKYEIKARKKPNAGAMIQGTSGGSNQHQGWKACKKHPLKPIFMLRILDAQWSKLLNEL